MLWGVQKIRQAHLISFRVLSCGGMEHEDNSEISCFPGCLFVFVCFRVMESNKRTTATLAGFRTALEYGYEGVILLITYTMADDSRCRSYWLALLSRWKSTIAFPKLLVCVPFV